MPDDDRDNAKDPGEKPGDQESHMTRKPPVLKELSGDASKVPVLDELVTTGNDTENRNGEDQETSHQHNIDDIADRIEKKLSHELDEIVTLLRDSLKDSIKTELQDQVNKDKENNSDSK